MISNSKLNKYHIDMKILDKEVKAAIFDMDGTLIDSTGIWKEIDKEFFSKRGFDVVPDDYAEEIVHLGLVKGAQMTIDRYHLSNETVDSIIKEWTDASIEQYEHKIPLKEGAKEILDFLKSNGVLLALATANSENLYRPCLKRLGIDKYFDVIMDVNSVKEGKSSVKLYHAVSEKLNIKPEETLVLEDVVTGLKTAFENGYISIAVYDKNTSSSHEEMCQNSYKYIYSLKELINR